ncbi:MAG: hypothetical protein D3923_08415 [Candidatus Electrothrix sp. AR3]|nr:hypothetical protein [Candidatus Electrothrix sp. AR3]
MKSATASVPAKIHLTGEHSVVYEKPALLASVNLRSHTTITESPDSKISLCSDKLSCAKSYELQDIIKYWRKTQETWQPTQKSNKILERLRREDPFVVILATIGQYFDRINELPHPFSATIKSEIPLGSGLGSSASVAASLLVALDRYTSKVVEVENHQYLKQVNKKVYNIERIMHGNPSGGDNTATVFGGIICLQQIDGKFTTRHLDINEEVFPQLVLIDSGKPYEKTGDMVDYVKRIDTYHKVRIIKKISEVSEGVIRNFKQNIFDPLLMTENEYLLEELGVVGDNAKIIIRNIEKIGGNAKITGAGGIKKGSGMILAFHHDYKRLIDFVAENKWTYYTPKIGVRGAA